MLYTRKGDKGTTKVFNCDQRFSKNEIVAEALGTMDELNSFLGLCKTHAKREGLSVGNSAVYEIVDTAQQNLFIIQAQIAGANKSMTNKKVSEMETVIDEIEKKLSPINSFFVSGGTELATFFDIARTIARRAERRLVAFYLERDGAVSAYGKNSDDKADDVLNPVLVYANRLSSLLYVLARFANNNAGVSEETPAYNRQ